jgi:hypothetical protein
MREGVEQASHPRDDLCFAFIGEAGTSFPDPSSRVLEDRGSFVRTPGFVEEAVARAPRNTGPGFLIGSC